MDLNIHPPLPARKDFRIGVIGSGFIVDSCHLVAYRKAGFNPVAIASRRREHAAEVANRHGIPRVYDSCEQLLEDPSIEVLDIAVPPNVQLGVIRAACARKTLKGILAQKPLGSCYAEALEAVNTCEAAGIKLAVNQNMRYDQSVRAGKTLLQNGTIGDPVLATVEMRAIPHWMDWQKEQGWLTLRIMSIHHLDTFRYWFGDPDGIYCSIREDPRTRFPHQDGICTYILDYRSGLRCVGIDDTWAGPVKEGCPGENYIRWRIEGVNGLAIGDIGWCKDPYTSPSTLRYASKGQKEFQSPLWPQSWFPDAFVGTMAQLLIAIENGTEPAVGGRDNLKTMALVEAAYLSASQLRSVEMATLRLAGTPPRDPVREKPKGFFGRLLSAPNVPAGSSPGSPPKGADYGTFDPRAQQLLALARREAEKLNHNFVGTEHLLLGLLALGGSGVTVLTRRGLDVVKVSAKILEMIGSGPPSATVGHIPYTPRTKKVLALAARKAKALNHPYVGTGHILLGLIAVKDGTAARVLAKLGVDLNMTRQEILKELEPFSDQGK